MLKILIADDHPIVRKGLGQVLLENSDIGEVEEAGDGREVLTRVQGTAYDAVLLDISMPGMDGLDILRQLKEIYPKLPVLMITMYPEKQYAMRAIKSGAAGYLMKDSSPDELIRAVRLVAQGRRYISESLAEEMAFSLGRDEDGLPHEALSDREFQVMCRIASGKTATEIAEELALSVKTVSTYRSRIMEKMSMQRNAELIHYAIQHHLVEQGPSRA